LLQSENDLVDSDTQIATDLVNLYRALGGGWEVADVAYRADRAKIGAR
jgi:outer membrane protein TolC